MPRSGKAHTNITIVLHPMQRHWACSRLASEINELVRRKKAVACLRKRRKPHICAAVYHINKKAIDVATKLHKGKTSRVVIQSAAIFF